MAGRESPSPVSVIRAHRGGASVQTDTQAARVAAGHEIADPIATFHFDGRVEGMVYPSLSAAQQDSFKADFHREVASLNRWAREQNWLPALPVDVQVFVSDDYRISRALLPASVAQRGRMEFPAWKVVAGEAAIAHELVHVFFPNGNRMLAEGLAVYLQAKMGSNPAFPNFGRPLHGLVRDLARKMVPEFTRGNPDSLDKIQLSALDKIATPSPLRLRVGLNLYQDDASGQAHIYPIVGSFVQFLFETYGTDKLRNLFLQTPLVPFERNAGSPDRWSEVYGFSIIDLAVQWRSLIADEPA